MAQNEFYIPTVIIACQASLEMYVERTKKSLDIFFEPLMKPYKKYKFFGPLITPADRKEALARYYKAHNGCIFGSYVYWDINHRYDSEIIRIRQILRTAYALENNSVRHMNLSFDQFDLIAASYVI
jgi:hypothetical protein